MSFLGEEFESFIVDCSTTDGGKSGGLILLWNPIFKVEIKGHDFYYIDSIITSSIDNNCWRCTRIYGYPQQQFLTCDTIYNLASNNWNPNWLIFGDFNMVLNSGEKLGRNPLELNITHLFRDTINGCNLNDLSFKGDIFTWANNQEDTHIK